MNIMLSMTLFCSILAISLALPSFTGHDGLNDFLDDDKFDDLFNKNKLTDFVDELKGVGKRTKETLKKAGDWRKRLDGQRSNRRGVDDKKEFNKFFNFIAKFEKSYDNDTHIENHFNKFKSSILKVQELQKKMPLTKFGLTKFSDLSPEEFIHQFTGVRDVKSVQSIFQNASSLVVRAKRSTLPKAWDWREHDGVTPVKNQNGCGACYAFAAVAAIESHFKITEKRELDLSEQQAVSCTFNQPNYGNNLGCNGGQSDYVIRYACEQGLTTEDQYPYTSGSTAQVPACQTASPVAKTNAVVYIPADDEDNMALVIYTYKPIVTYLDARPMQYYAGGVLDGAQPADGWQINHAVLTVGFGEENGVPYWIIKNSWGPEFGEAGYIKVRRGTNNLNVAKYNYGVV